MRLIKILVSVVVVVIAGLVALMVLLPGEKIAKIAADQVKSYTGRDLVFDGEVGISWYPVLGISTGPVTFGNAEWSDAGPMFAADSVAIGVDVISALTGNIRITRIEADAPRVILEKALDGRVNWEMAGTATDIGASEASQTSATGGLVLENLRISDAALTYIDHAGEQFDIQDVDLSLAWLGAGQPADIDLRLSPAGTPVEVTSRITDLEALLAGSVTRVTAVMKAADALLSFDGRAGTAPQAEGRVEADIPDPDAFLTALGLIPASLQGDASFSGEVTLTREGQISLRNGKAALGPNSIGIGLDVFPGDERPRVVAQLVAGALDLSGFLAGGGGDAAATPGWSKARIDASALGLIDGEIGFAATSLNLGTLKFGKTRVQIDIDRSRAVIDLNELQGYQGGVTGQFIANNRNGLSVGGDIRARSVEVADLLSDLMSMDRVSGKADANLNFLGSGSSIDAIMHSLNGAGDIGFGQGRISGIDLDKLFRGSALGGTTIFDSLSATAVIKDGVLSNDDLTLDLPSIIATGKGTVGLGPRNIDYTFNPQLKAEAGDGLAVPVRMQGSWDAPKIWPDLEALVGQNLEAEKKKVEEALKNEVSKKLGVVAEEGENIEDTVKKKVEDEVGKQLKNLLGGN